QIDELLGLPIDDVAWITSVNKDGKIKITKCDTILKTAPLKVLKTTFKKFINPSDTDSEDDDNILRNNWLSQPKSHHYSMCNMLPRKVKTLGYSQSLQNISSFCLTSKSKQTHSRNRHLRLLLPDQEGDSSFSDSTEDSFDKDYSSEGEEDYISYEMESLLCPRMEDSGLGLLARFAANEPPNPILSQPSSIVHLDEKRTIEEDKQNLIGIFLSKM
ncbi:unnamed protein product, partial [Ranitomeya imitator]